MNSIEANFEQVDFDNYSDRQIQNMNYTITNEEKASAFIGRDKYVSQIKEHCESKDNNTVMVVSGEPGIGKTSIILIEDFPMPGSTDTYAAHECIRKRDSENTFVFVHGVDTCPESNRLDKMLLRVHVNLCEFLNVENRLTSDEDLKMKH